MDDKCFCHLNGYAVKDATARKSIEELSKKVDDLVNDLSKILEALKEI